MGQEQSAVTVSEVASVTARDRRCYVTSKLDELCDYDRLWEELRSGLRADFSKDPNLKSGEVKEHTDDVFDVLKVYDGVKLQAPTPDVILKTKVILDKENGEVREEIRDLLVDALQEVRIVKTLRNPLRLEVRGQKMSQEHRYGPIPQATLFSILRSITKQDNIVTHPGRPSRLAPGNLDPRFLVVESQPLDDLISFEDLVAGIVDQYKTMAFIDFAKSETVKVRSERKEEHRESVKDFFETRFFVDGAKLVERQMAQEAVDRMWKVQVEHGGPKAPDAAGSGDDAKKDEVKAAPQVHFITANHWDHESSYLVDQSVMVVFGGPPLVVECWHHTALPYDVPSADPYWLIFRITLLMMTQGWSNVLVERLSRPGA